MRITTWNIKSFSDRTFPGVAITPEDQLKQEIIEMVAQCSDIFVIVEVQNNDAGIAGVQNLTWHLNQAILLGQPESPLCQCAAIPNNWVYIISPATPVRAGDAVERYAVLYKQSAVTTAAQLYSIPGNPNVYQIPQDGFFLPEWDVNLYGRPPYVWPFQYYARNIPFFLYAYHASLRDPAAEMTALSQNVLLRATTPTNPPFNIPSIIAGDFNLTTTNAQNTYLNAFRNFNPNSPGRTTWVRVAPSWEMWQQNRFTNEPRDNILVSNRVQAVANRADPALVPILTELVRQNWNYNLQFMPDGNVTGTPIIFPSDALWAMQLVSDHAPVFVDIV